MNTSHTRRTRAYVQVGLVSVLGIAGLEMGFNATESAVPINVRLENSSTEPCGSGGSFAGFIACEITVELKP